MKKTEVFKNSNRLHTRVGNVGYLAVQDALEFVTAIRSDAMDTIFLDPPFNLGKGYAVEDDRNLEKLTALSYGKYMQALIRECVRVMVPGGSLYLYHLPEWAIRFSAVLMEELEFRHWIAITMKNGFARGHRLYPAHYALLYYTKGRPSTFVRPRIDPSTCRHCGKYIHDYGGYRAIIEEKGVNLSDVWEDTSPVRHASRKHRAANELPRLITDRVVAISGRADGWFLDPFVGTGTSLVSAVHAGMRFVAGDLSSSAVEVTKNRVLDLL